ncbi:MAG: carboxypeptidase-like regulatory domain-containing protein [Pyrinomonadaceae bacterium]
MNALNRIAVVTIVLFATTLFGQTNSSLIISVSDPNGNIVVGAATVISADNGFRQNAVSSELGVASFRGLASGTYLLTITVDGFKEYKSLPIVLKPGETKRIDIVLELAQIESKVDVTEQDAVDPTNGSDSQSLKKKDIENLPTDPDELKRALQSIAGQTITGDEMEISVNGIPGAKLPNKENIKLVRINRNIFSAQYEYTNGGGIEIFTNDDIKKISGSVGASFGDARFNATNPYIGQRVPYRSKGIRYGISAPLTKKSSFSWNSDYDWTHSSSAVTATVLDANFVPVELRRSYETSNFESWDYAFFNWDPNKKHKVVASFDFSFGKSANSGVEGLALESRANRVRSGDASFAMTETYIISPDVVNTTRLRGSIDANSTKALNSASAISVNEAFLGGGSQDDREYKNSRFQIFNDTTRKVGRLNIGFGGMFRAYRNKEISRSNFGGTYTFSGRIVPVLDANYQPIRDGAGNIVTSQVTSLETYRRTVLLRSLGFSPAQIRTLGGGADQFTISGGNPELSVRQYDYSFYQQNSFGLSATTGISFGLRYENQSNIDDGSNFAPRFGFTWSPKAKEKQKPVTTLPRISIGYGIFYRRFDIGSTMSERLANAPDRAFYFITDPLILERFPTVPSVSELQQSSTLRSLRLIDDALHTPLQNIVSINVSKALWADINLNISYSRTLSSRSAVTRNINAPLAAVAGSTAPPVYPLGNSRNTHETRSEGRGRSDRIYVSSNLPQWKFFGKQIYSSIRYGYSKVSNDSVAGSGSPFDPYDLSREWAPTTGDGVHTLNAYFNIPLPGSISISSDINFRTGSRFNIITGRDTNRDGIYAERPAFATDPNKPGVIQTRYGLLDPSPTSAERLIPRNMARGPIYRMVNTYITKSFGFNRDKANKNEPRQNLNFSVWISNVFNINNKRNPIGNMSSPNILRSVPGSSFDGDFWSSGSPRRLHFSTGFWF